MKSNIIWVIVIVVILVIGGIFAWQTVFKKSAEGEVCQTNKNCEAGLKCIMNICSSGKVGSPCLSKADCQTQFCVQNKCTEGKEGNPCVSYNDCNELLCVNSVCSKFSEKPDEAMFKKYFTRFRLGIVTEWPKEGPPLFQETNIFKLSDQFCTDGTVLKDVSAQGEIYDPYEEVVVVPRMSGVLKQGSFTGCSYLPPELFAGKKYEYKVYIGDTLVAVLPFEVVEK